MSSGSASLRDTYSTPPTSWSFVPPPANGSSTAAGPSAVEPSFQWSSRPRPNSIYELSPDLSLDPSTPNALAIIRAAGASAILQFLSTAVENPWEVGKTLLQIQYIPRNASAVEDLDVPPEDEETSDESSTENEDSYFVDEAGSSSRVNTPRPTDDRGYVVRRTVTDSATRPDWVLPPGNVDGVWEMMKQVGRWKPEGWLALWKGTATGCVKTFLDASLQPVFQSIFTSLFTAIYISPSPAAFSRSHHIFLPVASSLCTGILLSPLDLIRTRLIAQTSFSAHRRYTGPFDALNQILLHEGGMRGIYLHPQLLYPALLDCTITPLAAIATPRLVLRLLGPNFTEESHPLLWSFAQLAGACASLLVTVPIETIRRRLQVQTRGSALPLPTCVEVRRRPYVGVVDTMYSILTEERSDLPLKPRKHRHEHTRRASRSKKGKDKEEPEELIEVQEGTGWLRHTGIGQLYQGLSMRVGASVIIFVLSMFASESNEASGWTEL